MLNTPDLLAYYRLQETTGATNPLNEVINATDLTTYHTGTTPDLLTFGQTGPITGGAALGVKPGDSEIAGDFGFLDVNLPGWGNAYTVEMWFKADQLPVIQEAQRLFNRTTSEPGTSTTNGQGEGFVIHGGNTNGVNKGIGITGRVGSTTTRNIPAIELNKTSWYYAVLTRTGAEATDTLTLYIKELLIDGEGNRTAGPLDTTISLTLAIATASDESPTAAFGARRDDTAATAFKGSIAEVAIYNTALTEGQINAHFGAVIPEPGSLLLLGAGATMMLYRRRTVS